MKSVLFTASLTVAMLGLLVGTSGVVQAISGTCSWHGGVNCSAGADWDGSAICNDGWRDSTEIYSQQQICSSTRYGCSNAEQIYAKYGLTAKLEVMSSLLKQNMSLYDDCVAKATAVTNIYEQTTQILQCTADNTYRQAQYNHLVSEYDRLKRSADAECEQSGMLEQEQIKRESGYYSPEQSIPRYTCPANLIVSGDRCICAEGYIYNGSVCVSYTQNCQTTYGVGSDGNKQGCYCLSGYALNSPRTACVKTEIQPTLSPPVTQPIAPVAGDNNAGQYIPIRGLASGTLDVAEVKGDTSTTASSTPEEISVPKAEAEKVSKPGFFARAFGSIKNFFLKIFR